MLSLQLLKKEEKSGGEVEGERLKKLEQTIKELQQKVRTAT